MDPEWAPPCDVNLENFLHGSQIPLLQSWDLPPGCSGRVFLRRVLGQRQRLFPEQSQHHGAAASDRPCPSCWSTFSSPLDSDIRMDSPPRRSLSTVPQCHFRHGEDSTLGVERQHLDEWRERGW